MSIIPNNNLQTFVLITMGKWSLHFLMRRLLFTTDGDQYKTKTNLRSLQETTINQNAELLSPLPNGRYTKYSHKNAQERGIQKSWKNQRISKFVARLCLVSPSNIRIYTHKGSPAWLPKPKLHKMTPMDMPSWRKACETTTLYKLLKVTKESREPEKWSSGKSTTTGCTVTIC